MTTAYIAGPMTRMPEFNFPAFQAAAQKWRDRGFTIISPHEHDLDNGFNPQGMTGHEDLTGVFDLKAALLWDLEQVANADGLILLKGWEGSAGARAELSLAAALGKWAIEDEFGGEQAPAATFLRPLTSSGETRVVNPATGGQKGSKLARFDLIPAGPLWDLAEHYGRGSRKYADRNWEKGVNWSLSFAALMRHAWAFWNGEDHDEETGSKHMIAVAWHAFALAEFMDTHPLLDDRPGRVS